MALGILEQDPHISHILSTKGDYNLNPQPNDEDVSWDLSSSRPGVQAPAAVASGVGFCAVGPFLVGVPVAVLPLISLTLNP